MNTKIKIILLINIVFFFAWQITAQTNKYIYLDSSEKVEKLNASGKFIGLLLENKNNYKRKGMLYDTSGNKLFEYKTNTAHLKNFLPNERNLQVIVINEHYDNQTDMDEIVSYDINNKSVMWKAKAIGLYYIISPDGKYLLTAHHHEDADIRQDSRLNIINLDNGNILPLNENYTNFVADWYDSSRIIINTWEFEFVKNEQFTDNFARYAKALDSISKIRAKLYSDLKSGDLSKDEYDTTLLHLNNDQKNIIISQRKQLATQGMPYDSKVREYKLIKYNILTHQIEMEKNIKEGEDFPTLAKQIFIGKYLGEKNVFVADLNKLYKLDSNFNLIWNVELEFPFYEIIENDKIYFVMYEMKGDVYKLITKNGQKQLLSKTDDIVVKIQKNKLEYSSSDIIDSRGNFSFNREDNSIKLSKE